METTNDFGYIDDNDVVGHIYTPRRTYKLISSGRYSWDQIKFNEDCATEWLSYGTLELNDSVSDTYSVYMQNAIHYYVKRMDKFRPGDIIVLYHREKFERLEYVLLDDDIIIDNYGIGCHLQRLELASPHDYISIDKSVLGTALDELPVVDSYTWFDFIFYYSPELVKFNKYKKDKLLDYSTAIKQYEDTIRYYEKSIDILKNDMRDFSRKFRDYIKHIRQTASSK